MVIHRDQEFEGLVGQDAEAYGFKAATTDSYRRKRRDQLQWRLKPAGYEPRQREMGDGLCGRLLFAPGCRSPWQRVHPNNCHALEITGSPSSNTCTRWRLVQESHRVEQMVSSKLRNG